MELPQHMVDEFKRICKEEKGVELSDSEARVEAQRFADFVELCYELALKEEVRKRRLVKEPSGYHYSDGKSYTCPICMKTIKDVEVWYDDCGHKCMDCQENLNKRKMPKSMFKDHQSWFSIYGLELRYGIKKKEIMRYVTEGRLKMRTFKNRKGRDYLRVFLLKDNPCLMPATAPTDADK